jgi:hypothetical protein
MFAAGERERCVDHLKVAAIDRAVHHVNARGQVAEAKVLYLVRAGTAEIKSRGIHAQRVASAPRKRFANGVVVRACENGWMIQIGGAL